MKAKILAALALTLLPAMPILTPAPAEASVKQCQLPGDATDKATRLAAQLNGFRASQGLRAVKHDASLSRAAQVQACDLAASGRFGHAGSDGSNHRVRLERTGYCAGVSGENLAWGYPRATQIVGGWQGSPGHRQVMSLDRAQQFGVGLAQGAKGPIWVLVMAQPC